MRADRIASAASGQKKLWGHDTINVNR